MNNNPSPGNKAGGLTTILEKSLGAAAKGGVSPLADVALYGEKITSKGFIFMDSPGYDPASVTGQIACGCQIVCFTTGRGSAFGSKPAPTIKLATNSRTYTTMEEDMDINCGDIVDGDATIEFKGEEIFREDPRRRLRRTLQERDSRPWRQRIRALADRRGDVGQFELQVRRPDSRSRSVEHRLILGGRRV